MFTRTAAPAAFRPCACALLAMLGSLSITASGAEPLTLDAALQRVVATHPALQALDLGTSALQAEAERAAQRPALTAAADVENVAGSGARSGVDAAEWTLSLAGTLERGGKRALRESLAARRIDAQAPRRAALALQLLTETAQRYLDLASADAESLLAQTELTERERWAEQARQRTRAGASPEAVPLLASAQAARARFELQRATARRELAWRRLAALWGGEGEPPGEVAATDLLALPDAPDVAGLLAQLAHHPDTGLLVAEERQREARLRLAEAARASDLQWHAGVRRHADGDDWALVGGITVPLDASARAEPEIRAARLELQALAFERDAATRRLTGLLLEAQGLYVTSKLEVERLRDDLLPSYDEASAAAERAWRAGAMGPFEWSELQGERLAARRTQLAAAVAARRALIEIQGLTAEPLRTPTEIRR